MALQIHGVWACFPPMRHCASAPPYHGGMTTAVGPAGRRQPMCHLAFCRHGMSPVLSASIEHVGTDDLHEPVVVSVVHWDADDHGSLHGESPVKCGCDLLGPFNRQPLSTEGLSKGHDVNRAELDARGAAALGPFLAMDHVIPPVDPHQVDEVAFEPDRRLEFARRI
jgi:hypothetical protein